MIPQLDIVEYHVPSSIPGGGMIRRYVAAHRAPSGWIWSPEERARYHARRDEPTRDLAHADKLGYYRERIARGLRIPPVQSHRGGICREWYAGLQDALWPEDAPHPVRGRGAGDLIGIRRGTPLRPRYTR